MGGQKRPKICLRSYWMAPSGLLMFSWQIWDANLIDNSKIGTEFEQNKLALRSMYRWIHCSNSSPILELSVKFASQICHENINKPLDGAYLADFDIDIKHPHTFCEKRGRSPFIVCFGTERKLTQEFLIFWCSIKIGIWAHWANTPCNLCEPYIQCNEQTIY